MIGVVGAGPAGTHYASLIKDEDVTIFEKNSKAGYPIQCTGIVTDSIKRVIDIPDELVVATIKKFRIVAPNGKSVDIDLDKENKVMDRARFDQYLAQKAEDNGAKILLNHTFQGFKKNGDSFKIITDKGSFESRMLVGADGPLSPVAKAAGMFGERQFLQGLQVRAHYKGEPGITEIHMGLGEFAWVVPEDEHVARIGVIGKNVAGAFKQLVGSHDVIEPQSGLVPLYNPKQVLAKDGAYLIGDAATQVKATTYGGIIYGLLAGSYLAENPDSYAKKFNSKLGRDLWMSLKMREAMNSMTQDQYDELIQIFNQSSSKKILEEHDRDFPTKFIVQLLLKESKLWRLGFSVLKKSMFSKENDDPSQQE
ncbi:hypothetical protein COT72_04270 [archaeon CG10_big_fil_rev_8_21_14_0_10_43_11]|nr:MAG: hypothetical protein COT72_04270 [archaeon CG10_big_fil_rev_8_21_14_0_10_43_11]